MKPCYFCKKNIDEYASDTRLLDAGNKGIRPHDGRVACAKCLALDHLKRSTVITKLDFYVIGVLIAAAIDRGNIDAGFEPKTGATALLAEVYADELEGA